VGTSNADFGRQIGQSLSWLSIAALAVLHPWQIVGRA
jgi:hypothetical protein